jgi:hypothetical protein
MFLPALTESPFSRLNKTKAAREATHAAFFMSTNRNLVN